ncbi:ribosomal large subunit pseudouridine synthase D [Sulfuritortus calidifontis]|uniref:Pseudouridine synthase n=1 Tax=Sulfuritortus calidifontis TaxID=1914471 RepID=A0A4R3JUI6_9PROT|nr:23S rRNA pseudouridine(1911/1915/1917) synthase RluD [Sulfuritortus calidifontis]TCS71489.1 ribosomal large subunit pseudouridine synthase D [Sulfuritortus calidifontis]
MSQTLTFIIPVEHAGRRLDQSLAELLPDYSRSRIQAWCDEGLVRVDGKPASRKHKLWGGEAIEVQPQVHPSEQPHQAEAIALDIVYEDADVLVLNKPAGLVTHPGAGNWAGTLLNALLHHAPQLAEVPRAGIVHRLDKETSGLMVVAKTLTAQTRLVRELQARTVRRTYWAVAMGELARDAGEIEAPIGRHPTQRTRMAVVDSGKPALTRYKVLKRYPGATWVECQLATGRTHQIRVHLAYLGHPLVGDPVYLGHRKGRWDFHRQALHALRLGFEHPVSGEPLAFEAPPPADFKQLLEALDAAE